MAQNPVKPIRGPSADGLAAAVGQAARKGPPPVHLWNPDYCGDLDIEIRRDGQWFYLGTPIGREALVKLFASILKLEDGRYYLVTPVEKVGIRVEDVPFIAVDAEAVGEGAAQVLTFTTNVGDQVLANADARIRVVRDPDTGDPDIGNLTAPELERLTDPEGINYTTVSYTHLTLPTSDLV